MKALCHGRTVWFRIPAMATLSLLLSAHSWYPLACCSEHDCAPVTEGAVQYRPEGWFVVPTGETIPYDKAQPAPDGRFHLCLYKTSDGATHTRCLFVPDVGS